MKISFCFFRFFLPAFLFFALFATVHLSFSLPIFPKASAQDSIKKREDAYRSNNLGVAQLEQFNHREAAESFRRALSIQPDLKIAQINLAIALFNVPDYENAQKEVQRAASIAPTSPQPFYILGLIARTQNRSEAAVSAFKRVLEIDAADVGANVNLGQIYMQERRYDEAIAVFRAALASEPYNSTALYNLATALLRAGKREEGQQLMTRFQSLRQSGAATSIGQNYLEQGRYAEAIVSTGAESELVDKTTPNVVFQNSNASLPVQKPQNEIPLGNLFHLKPKSKFEILLRFARGATLFDFDNDGDLDLVRLNNSIAAPRRISNRESNANVTGSVSLYRNDGGKFVDATKTSGDLAKTVKNVSTGIIAGDFDNDGLADLFVNGYEQMRLLRNLGKGRFEDVSEKAKLPKYPYLSISAAFLDAEHDGDLDIFIAGFTDLEVEENAETKELLFPLDFAPAPNWLLRNNGDGTFAEIGNAANLNNSKTKNEKFQSEGNSIAVIPTDYDNRRDIDLLVLNYGGKPNLFRNWRDGSFRDVAAEVGLNQTGNWTCAAAGDFNKDNFVDFFFGKTGGAGVFAVSDGRGKFVLKDAPPGTENAASAQLVDYDNDGLLDLIVNTDKGFANVRNLGGSWSDADSSAFKIKTDELGALENSRFTLASDVDSDSDEDLFAFARNGNLVLVKNVGGNTNNAEIVKLAGRASNRTGIGAKIDLRAGSLAQKLETYAASPMPAPSDIHFGLGKREKPDAVRVVWTSGIIQAETDFPQKAKNPTAKNSAPLKIEELDRKPSSCPYLYAWNGEKFEFVTDFLGGGEMGNWKESGGVYHYPDSDEFVRITSDQLKPKNGRYEIRVTNELEEVLFVDNIKLIAIEHDASREVYPNEGLGIPTAGKRI
ncbi:MAG: FG-GAP-like repeat-containing protein, partial [Acidobacteriota bacterium]|nr:FG-GAP-like repeat-containing protein [Acidobacteriota bacterium]